MNWFTKYFGEQIEKAHERLQEQKDTEALLEFQKAVGTSIPITNFADLDLFLRAGGESQSGAVVNATTAQRQATVFSCIKIISESFAWIPSTLKKETGENIFEDATDHPLFKIFHDQPNEWMTPYEFKELAIRDRLVNGNFYAQIIRVGKEIKALIPIDPTSVFVELDESNKLKYTVTLDVRTKETRVLRKKDIFHYRGQLSSDWLTGMSIIKAAESSIGLAISSEDYGARLFKNGAAFRNVFSHPTKMSEGAQTNLQASLDKYRTTDQFRDLILEEGMTVSQVSMSAEDAQALETRQYQKQEIASMFNVPLSKLGDTSNTAFANVVSQERSFQTDTMNPYYTGFQETVSRCLLTEEERADFSLQFLNNEALRGDAETVTRILDMQIKNGMRSPNEGRIILGENPREDGDKFVDVTNINTGNTAKDPDGEEEDIDEDVDIEEEGAEEDGNDS